jgi:2-amino-4-hydroxy-6-hydroxymethyldihydropteridine diphosphokinase
VDALAALPGTTVTAVSSVYETARVGGPLQPDYLNIVVAMVTELAGPSLLVHVHTIEAALHRTREVRWGPRTADIDVIVYDDAVSDDPVLTLPHPRAGERRFVLVPWLELDPDAVLPAGGRVADLLDALDDQAVSRRDDLRVLLPYDPEESVRTRL